MQVELRMMRSFMVLERGSNVAKIRDSLLLQLTRHPLVCCKRRLNIARCCAACDERTYSQIQRNSLRVAFANNLPAHVIPPAFFWVRVTIDLRSSKEQLPALCAPGD